MGDDIIWHSVSETTGNRVEVGQLPNNRVIVRMSDKPEDILYFPERAWGEFIDGIRSGEFDLPLD